MPALPSCFSFKPKVALGVQIIALHDHVLTNEEIVERSRLWTTEEIVGPVMTEAQIELASSKCHECLMADYHIGQHKHCGSCYCCK